MKNVYIQLISYCTIFSECPPQISQFGNPASSIFLLIVTDKCHDISVTGVWTLVMQLAWILLWLSLPNFCCAIVIFLGLEWKKNIKYQPCDLKKKEYLTTLVCHNELNESKRLNNKEIFLKHPVSAKQEHPFCRATSFLKA